MHNTKMTWYPYVDDDEMAQSPAPTDADGHSLPSDD
jgi:ferredoxin-nitrite reductase